MENIIRDLVITPFTGIMNRIEAGEKPTEKDVEELEKINKNLKNVGVNENE